MGKQVPRYSEEDLDRMVAKVRGSTDARRTTDSGSSCKAAIQQTKSQRGELAPSPLTLLLTGQLPSGKNQVQLLFRNGKVMKYPNKTFINWRQRSHLQILERLPWSKNQTINVRDMKPWISLPVHLTCEYTPGDLRTRDVSGQLDALFHLLVYAKVLKDDGLVHDVTWRRQPMDRKQPRITLNLEAV